MMAEPFSLFLTERVNTRNMEGCAISMVVEGLKGLWEMGQGLWGEEDDAGRE